jgi:hypothetical protein
LITYRQARIRAGLSHRQIAYRLASKRWRELQPRVYAVAGTPGSWLQTAHAAQLCARREQVVTRNKRQRLEELDDAVLTGSTALWLRGVTRLGQPAKHELLIARKRIPVVSGSTVRATRSLPPRDVEVVDGVPTLCVPRLLVELCGRIGDVDFVAVLDELLGAGDARLRQDVYARAAELRNGRRAVARLLELTRPGAETAFRSWLERHTCELFSAHGLPAAEWNVELRDAGGKLIGFGDAVWRDAKVVVELDGLQFHTSPQQRRRDNQKDRRLATEGWLVLRYTWLDVTERADEIVTDVSAALAARR